MGTLTFSELRSKADERTRYVNKSASLLLSESVKAQSQSPSSGYDIFLSHSFQDAKVIYGLKLKLEQDFGHSVYVDWLEDPLLDRSRVTPGTAEIIRARMARCKCLLYAATDNSTQSKWMPWECGYFDGKFGRSAILPITEYSSSDFKGQEYLGIYPYVTADPKRDSTKRVLWVQKSPNVYCPLTSWLNGSQPVPH